MSNYSKKTQYLIEQISSLEFEKTQKIWEINHKIEQARNDLRSRLFENKIEALFYLSIVKPDEDLSDEMKACAKLVEDGVFKIASLNRDDKIKFVLWLNKRLDNESVHDFIKRHFEQFKKNTMSSNEIIGINRHADKNALIFYFAPLKEMSIADNFVQQKSPLY